MATRLQGVTTTGIYCRAECTARPRADHVRPYPTRVAAEAAGYRPCLRCRPDRLPDVAPEVPPAVAHALVLISDGELDRIGEDELAGRVGYSGRQLRRLFLDHIGATPDFVARSRRAHFARRLLDETDLPVADIAFAAGFRSVRQTNRVVKDVFGFTPTELRARRRRGDCRSPIDGGLALRVPFEGQLPARRSIEALTPRAIPGVEQVVDGRYRRIVDSCGHAGVVEVGDLEDGRHLDVVAHLPTFASLIDVVARARALFGADVDPAPAVDALGPDPVIGPSVRAHPGVRFPGAWDRFETAIRIIVGQQVSVAAASTIAGRIAARHGPPVDIDDPGLDRRFPSAQSLAEGDLDGIGLPGQRVRTVRAFSAAVADGVIDLRRPGALDDIVDELVTVPGVGPWTAHLIAARVHRHPDAFPVSDLGLRRGAARLLGRNDDLTADELSALAERWRPHRATAAAHLWFSGGTTP